MIFSIICFLLSFVSIIKILFLEIRLNKELNTNHKLNSILCSLNSLNLRINNNQIIHSPFNESLPSLPSFETIEDIF